jgi:hypothetical protein
MIGKIEKAKRYADERADRVHFENFAVTFTGENNNHRVTFNNNTWSCTCDFFQSRGHCSHTIALERILEGMIPGPGETEPAIPVAEQDKV